MRRWSRQWAGSKTRELPLVDEIEERLRRDIPEQHGVTLVHGDYRFGNCISDLDGREIAAVLDWELCTLGDPLADLGHLGIYWYAPSQPASYERPDVRRRLPVFADLLERYASITERDVSRESATTRRSRRGGSRSSPRVWRRVTSSTTPRTRRR